MALWGRLEQVLQFPDDPEDEHLCGVGIVLYKAPDDSLFVKVKSHACVRERAVATLVAPTNVKPKGQ